MIETKIQIFGKGKEWSRVFKERGAKDTRGTFKLIATSKKVCQNAIFLYVGFFLICLVSFPSR